LVELFSFEAWRLRRGKREKAMRRVGPFSIVKRQGHFLVSKGRTVLSQHSRFLDAEDFALRAWLGQKRSHEEDDFDHDRFEQGADGAR
jgi:hypothetical protein